MTRKTRKAPRMGQDVGSDLCFGVSSRDRIAPDFTIRHPVLQIVALQRRVRFSARFAGFYRIRCHQRRARRAEEASFSVLVSNLDFRVPRLRQRGDWAADGAVQRRKRGYPRGPESRPGLPRRSRLARSGPGAARAWIQVSVASRCWTVFPLRVRGTRIADIASETPQIWGSPRGDDHRNGPARQS